MCGIVGAIAERNVSSILLEGLRRLEYRGYDSAGMSLVNEHTLTREREVGKVQALADAMQPNFTGMLGIAHTRWATHGEPAKHNAHPHHSGDIAVVHNGIIENFEALRSELQSKGYSFTSQTDTEVVAHLVHEAYQAQTEKDIFQAVQTIIPLLEGAYALGVVHADHPDLLIAVRQGSPLVIGVGIGENYISSDQLALLPVTNRFIYLDEGDSARITRDNIDIFQNGESVKRNVNELDAKLMNADKGEYKHYMLKEIYEQPDAISRTLAHAVQGNALKPGFLGTHEASLAGIQHVQILACGTSYHAGMVAKYWFEQLVGISCQVEIASEYRYRTPVILNNTLVICISQSGETADTLAALRDMQKKEPTGLVSLTVCNVPTSSMVRETHIHLLTDAGPEVGVASTKAFTTQLVALMLLVLKVGQIHGAMEAKTISEIIAGLHDLSEETRAALALDNEIETLAEHFEHKHHALFLGRGMQFPIALEGALKLKEISYIHAEGYAAGELKHGPLALVDKDMPIVILAPKDELLDKLKANMQEVHARHGELFVFAAHDSQIEADARIHVTYMPSVHPLLAPILYSIPVQLLSYHVAVQRGTDVDQPRNLAKSVTVE